MLDVGVVSRWWRGAKLSAGGTSAAPNPAWDCVREWDGGVDDAASGDGELNVVDLGRELPSPIEGPGDGDPALPYWFGRRWAASPGPLEAILEASDR